jgi:long-chain fatty acid transport protein
MSSPALAGAFGLREQSTVGLGMAFAGVAAGSAKLGSMFWNPATMTDMPGLQSDSSAAVIAPFAKLNTTAGSSPGYFNPVLGGSSSGNVGEAAFLPSSYSSWQVNDRLWLGVASNAPYGLMTKPDATWAGRAYGNSNKLFSLEVTPTVAYKVNDWLSVGAGLRVLYFDVRYTTAVPGRAPAPYWSVAGLDADNTSVGFNLGATIKPWAGGEIGIGYRSMVQQDLTGNFSGGEAFAPSLNVPAGLAGLLLNHPVKARLVLPETLTVGLKQDLNQQFSVALGAEWTNWSRLRAPRIYDTYTGRLHAAAPDLPLDYRDGWYFSVGGEYRINPVWTVRAGLGYEISPISDSTRSPRLPDSDRIWASLGASYNWNDKLSFDVSYAHLFGKSPDVRMVPGNPNYNPRLAAAGLNNLVASGSAHVDILSVGLRYRWDDPAKTIPVVANY